jgi:ParB family chromosome partitioning protein
MKLMPTQRLSPRRAPDEMSRRRFGVTRRHVDQRLALAGLSPKIKAAWKRGDVSLEAARAFCLVEEPRPAGSVFRSLGKPVTHAGSVRARLMEGRMRASDRLASFVGLEAYEAPGAPWCATCSMPKPSMLKIRH